MVNLESKTTTGQLTSAALPTAQQNAINFWMKGLPVSTITIAPVIVKTDG